MVIAIILKNIYIKARRPPFRQSKSINNNRLLILIDILEYPAPIPFRFYTKRKILKNIIIFFRILFFDKDCQISQQFLCPH